MAHYRDGSSLDGGVFVSIVNFSHATPWLQGFFHLVSSGELFILAILMCWGWWYAHKISTMAMAHAYTVPIVVSIAFLVNELIKYAVKELRPCRSLSNPYILTCPSKLHNYAFASNHTVLAVACAVGLWRINARLGIVAMTIACLIGFSRVYLGAHYPHDVWAGAIIGALIVVIWSPIIAQYIRNYMLSCCCKPSLQFLCTPIASPPWSSHREIS